MIKRVLFYLLPAFLIGCDQPEVPHTPGAIPERIISMAPNITETIYVLGLEHKLVGATTYCTYPETAKQIPRIGGFGQYNYEAIVSLQPDLVILHNEYENDKARLRSLNLTYLETGSYFISDILQTITDIGTACGAGEKAEKLITQLLRQINELTNETEKQKRVLITFGGSDQQTEQVHAFGTDCLHNELLEIAGGKNIVEGTLPYSVLSREAILRLNPDIIIQLAPGQPEVTDPLVAWQQFKNVNAVKGKQVYHFTGDYTCIPGPRFIQILADFSSILREAP